MKKNIIPYFKANVVKDKIIILEKDLFRKYVSRFEGKEVRITVDTEGKKRSLPQNNYYWGVVITLLSEHFGYYPEEMHDALRLKFLKNHEDKLLTVKSTTELSTVEFEEYLTQVRQFAAEEGIYIPLPNEVLI